MYPRERRRAFTWFVVILVVPFGLIMTVAGAFVLIGVTGGLDRLGLPGCGPPLEGGSSLLAPMASGTYRMTSGFGDRTNPITGEAEGHRGQDFAAAADTPIMAAAAGTVVAAGAAEGFGQWIVLDHQLGGRLVSTVYGHMWPSGVGVSVGETVQAGQPIARVGSNGQSTGPHLHFEVWEGGRFAGGRPVDPVPLLSEPDVAALPQPVSVAQVGALGPPSVAQLMPRPPSAPQRATSLTTEQLRNAGIIVGVGKGMDMPPRAWVIAIATALQESTLLNLDYGDRDSLGLFQQRPSQGWGTPEQIMDPEYAATRFYVAFADKVMRSTPGWESQPLTKLAQIVQRSGFPTAYAKWELTAVNAVLAVYGVPPIEGSQLRIC